MGHSVFVKTSDGWQELTLMGPKGDTGDTGPQGIQGIQGVKGDTGDTGPTGQAEAWFSGSSDPTSGTGSVGDWYLNTTSGDVFEKTGVSTWTNQGNIKGPKGDTGNTGPKGDTGAPGSWTTLKQVADQVVANQAVLQNSNTFTIAMTSGKTYVIRGVIFFDTTATGDFKYGWATPTVTRVRANLRANAAGASVQAEAAIATTLTASAALTGTTTTGGYLDFQIIFTAGSTASFTFQFAQNTQTNDAGAQVLKGSYMEYIQVD